MAKDLAIVLNNGSINCAVATALAAQKYRVVLLHGEINPQPASRLRAAYDQQVSHFKPYREHTLAMPFLTAVQNAGSRQPSANDPRQPTAMAEQMLELLPLLGAACRFAVHYQAGAIYLGLRTGPQPDDLAQATEFVQVWNELLNIPCAQGELEIVTPLLELEPFQVVDVGFQVNAPFDKTWSCLEESTDPCWACRGCRNREAAFVQAAKADPMKVIRKV